MIKKLALLIGLFCLLSCGPHRLKCGPGKRCVEVTNKKPSKTQKV